MRGSCFTTIFFSFRFSAHIYSTVYGNSFPLILLGDTVSSITTHRGVAQCVASSPVYNIFETGFSLYIVFIYAFYSRRSGNFETKPLILVVFNLTRRKLNGPSRSLEIHPEY